LTFYPGICKKSGDTGACDKKMPPPKGGKRRRHGRKGEHQEEAFLHITNPTTGTWLHTKQQIYKSPAGA
jgi:hypothetical protein